MIGGSGGINWGIGIIENNEIDIRGEVQFTRAQLAHAEDSETAADGGVIGIGQVKFPRVVGGTQQMRDRQRQGSLGQGGQGARDLLQLPKPADIRQRGGHRDDAFRASERGRDTGTRRGGRCGAQVRHRRRDDLIWPTRREGAQRRCFPYRQIGQVGAVPADAVQQRGARKVTCQALLRSPQFAEPFRQSLSRATVMWVGPVGGDGKACVRHGATGWP